jgi:hypothetical protein
VAEFDIVDASEGAAKASPSQPHVDRHFILDLAVRLHAGVALGPVNNNAVIETAREFERYMSETAP